MHGAEYKLAMVFIRSSSSGGGGASCLPFVTVERGREGGERVESAFVIWCLCLLSTVVGKKLNTNVEHRKL